MPVAARANLDLWMPRSRHAVEGGHLHRPAGHTAETPPTLELLDAHGNPVERKRKKPKGIRLTVGIDRTLLNPYTGEQATGRERRILPFRVGGAPTVATAIPVAMGAAQFPLRSTVSTVTSGGGSDPVPAIPGAIPSWRGDWLTSTGFDPAPLDGGNYNSYQCTPTNLLAVISSSVTSANFPPRLLEVIFDGTGVTGGSHCQMERASNKWAAPVVGVTPYLFLRWYWFCALGNWDGVEGSANDLGACHPFQEGDNGRWYTNVSSPSGGTQRWEFQLPALAYPQNRYGVRIATNTVWMCSVRFNLTTTTNCKISLRIHKVVTGVLTYQDADFLDRDDVNSLAADNPNLAVASGSDLRDIWIGNNGIGTNDQTPNKMIFFGAPAALVSASSGDWIQSWTLAHG